MWVDTSYVFISAVCIRLRKLTSLWLISRSSSLSSSALQGRNFVTICWRKERNRSDGNCSFRCESGWSVGIVENTIHITRYLQRLLLQNVLHGCQWNCLLSWSLLLFLPSCRIKKFQTYSCCLQSQTSLPHAVRERMSSVSLSARVYTLWRSCWTSSVHPSCSLNARGRLHASSCGCTWILEGIRTGVVHQN